MLNILTTTIDDAKLTSSSVPETDAALWAAGTYTVGTVVRRPNHRLYKDGAGGASATAPEADTTRWTDQGYVNRWRMFDDKISSITSAATSLTVTIKPGMADTLALLNVDAGRVKLTQRHGDPNTGAVISSKTISLNGTGNTSFYGYLFRGRQWRSRQAWFRGLVRDADSYITLEFDGLTTINVGACLVGTSVYLGELEWGFQYDIKQYTQTLLDPVTGEEGNTIVRPYAKRLSGTAVCTRKDFNRICRHYARIGTARSLWIGAENTTDYDEALLLYGRVSRFQPSPPNAAEARINFSIDGVI